jgi:hypothetical protein
MVFFSGRILCACADALFCVFAAARQAAHGIMKMDGLCKVDGEHCTCLLFYF